MVIDCYINTSDSRCVNKVLTALDTKQATYKDGYDILAPVFIFKNFNTKTNYVFVRELARFYYVENVTIVNNMYIVACSVDVLMSYRSSINNLSCLVTRQEYTYDRDIKDTRRVFKEGVDISNILVGQCGSSAFKYYLCVVGI